MGSMFSKSTFGPSEEELAAAYKKCPPPPGCEPTLPPEEELCDTAGGDGDGEEYRLETAPFDPRFPNQNQTKHCYVSFLDYKRCLKARGEEFEGCNYFKRVYTSLCPNAWVSKWEEQIEEGIFPGKI